jgi:hypothetical protein
MLRLLQSQNKLNLKINSINFRQNQTLVNDLIPQNTNLIANNFNPS